MSIPLLYGGRVATWCCLSVMVVLPMAILGASIGVSARPMALQIRCNRRATLAGIMVL